MNRALKHISVGGVAASLVSLSLAAGSVAQPPAAGDYRQRLPQDEVIYFLLPDRFENGDASNDRGGLTGGRFNQGVWFHRLIIASEARAACNALETAAPIPRVPPVTTATRAIASSLPFQARAMISRRRSSGQTADAAR